jgi:hypothetical protein
MHSPQPTECDNFESMRWLLVASVLLFLLVVAPSATPASFSPESSPKARLALVDLDPIEVRGYGFRRLERVTLTLLAGTSVRTRAVRANRTGRFVSRFDVVHVDRCSQGVGVVAVGAMGSAAAIASKAPRPDCPPPLVPPDG